MPLRLAALLLAALSLAPSWAHVLEMPVRLGWTADLWMATTVFGGLYALFGRVGAVIDVAAVVAAGLLAVALRRSPVRRGWAVAGTLALLAGLGAWGLLVAPMNAIMAGWTPGPPPADFAEVRLRWETGHAAVAAVKILALGALLVAVLAPPGVDRKRAGGLMS